jgi:COP9 signalosome complex subunit 8
MEFVDASSILNELDSQIKKLEETELRDQAATDEDVYKRLLIYYLLQDSEMKAKFLWKRVPDHFKQSNAEQQELSELNRLWQVAVLLIKRQYAQAFELVNRFKQEKNEFFRSIELNNLLALLVEKIRDRLFDLVNVAYSSIRIDELAKLVGLDCERALAAALKREWVLDETKEYLLPKLTVKTPQQTDNTNSEQMHQLTKLVSYLEAL